MAVPWAVRIGGTIFLAFLGLILVGSLIYNFYWVKPAVVTGLEARLEIDEEGLARPVFVLMLHEHAGPSFLPGSERPIEASSVAEAEPVAYQVSYADWSQVREGDRVIARTAGRGQAKIVRSRPPSFPEMVLEADRIVLAEISGITPDSVEIVVERTLKPSANTERQGEARIDTVALPMPDPNAESERFDSVRLQVGERVVLFLRDPSSGEVSSGGRLLYGPAGVVRIDARNRVRDVEFLLDARLDEMLADLERILQNQGNR